MSNIVYPECLAHFTFGEGKLAVQSGTVYGVPSLILAPAEHVGVPGAGVILTFKTEAHRDAVENALLGL